MNYQWRGADGSDVPNIVNMAVNHFQTEIDAIFKPEPVVYSRNITFAIVNQFYVPNAEVLAVTYEQDRLLAYTWATSNERAPWSDDRMVAVRMAHVDLEATAKQRVLLIKDMMEIWENFARASDTPIICSTTMRRDQTAFLKLHERNGYDCRGSYAYKRITL